MSIDNFETKIKEEQLKLVEDIQECIVRAGGRFFRHQEILDMTIRDFTRLFTSNNVHLNATYTHSNDLKEVHIHSESKVIGDSETKAKVRREYESRAIGAGSSTFNKEIDDPKELGKPLCK